MPEGAGPSSFTGWLDCGPKVGYGVGVNSTERRRVAKPNYQFEKRQRELEKKKKKAEKAQRKAAGHDGAAPEHDADAGLQAGAPLPEAGLPEGAPAPASEG